MTPDDPLQRGRAAYDRRAWAEAFADLSAADATASLELEDLEHLARSAQLLARDVDSDALWERAHQEAVRRGDTARAVRCTFWLGMSLLSRGETARGNGWFARGQRLLREADDDAPEDAYLLVPTAVQALFVGDVATAHRTFQRICELGTRFDDPDLVTLGRLGCGQALIRLGRLVDGVAMLDEAMVTVLADEVSPVVAGVVYCNVIDACHGLFDLRRAREWSDALTSWCAAQPDLVPFRGQCLVHRAEMMRFGGAWSEALDEVERAEAIVTDQRGQGVLAGAAYQKAELHRLRGELGAAEAAYRQASEWGREPHPGLALLRLAQGRLDDAAAAIRRVAAETKDPVPRAAILAAYVEIMLAVDDIDAAQAGATELGARALELEAPFLDAMAAYSAGAVLLARGQARPAIGELRRASARWREVDAPYEAARTRVLLGLACQQLGDQDTSVMELDAARRAFEQLGAAADLARLDQLVGSGRRAAAGGLTGRELEVLQAVATGKTNREIADDLVISEKTVARHVANIFVKLGVSSRAAATAHAYRHGLS